MCTVPQESKYWECDQNGVVFTNPKINVTKQYTSISKVIFDSGTSFIIAPIKEVSIITDYLSTYYKGRCKLNEFHQIMCMCDSIDDFGSMQFNFGAQDKFTIDFKDIIFYIPEDVYQCKIQILIDVFDLDYWILGDSALRSTLISFNIDSRNIKWVNIPRALGQASLNMGIKGDSKRRGSTFWFLNPFYILIGLILVSMLAVLIYTLFK